MQTNTISLTDALELMVFCNHLGQIDQKSEFETRLYDELSKKVTDKFKDPKELCFIWMFLRSWGPSGKDFKLVKIRSDYPVQSFSLCIEVLFEAHPRITEKFNEDHLRCAISEIMIGPKDNSDDVLLVIQKLREQLEQSATEIFPFFEACSRKVHETIRVHHFEFIKDDLCYNKSTVYNLWLHRC